MLEKIGLPKLGDVVEILHNIPDERKLRLLNNLIRDLQGMKQGPEELLMVLQVLRLISEVDGKKLEDIKEITANLYKLVKYLPKDLPIGEIASSLMKEMHGETR